LSFKLTQHPLCFHFDWQANLPSRPSLSPAPPTRPALPLSRPSRRALPQLAVWDANGKPFKSLGACPLCRSAPPPHLPPRERHCLIMGCALAWRAARLQPLSTAFTFPMPAFVLSSAPPRLLGLPTLRPSTARGARPEGPRLPDLPPPPCPAPFSLTAPPRRRLGACPARQVG